MKSALRLGLGLILVGVVASCSSSGATPTHSLHAPGSPSAAPTFTGPSAAATLAGTSISGHVRDEAGSGIEGISVTALGVNGGSGMGGYSGSDGTFVLRGLTAGDYIVQFTDELSTHASGFYSSSGLTLNGNKATHVTVGTSPVSGIDVVLPTGYSLSGTVRQPDGTPVPGVEVSVCPKLASSCPTYPTWTARDGTYTLAGIASGTYVVDFADPWQGQAPKVNLPDVTIGDTGIAGYDLTAPVGWLTPGASISGVVLSATGNPLAGVRVEVTPSGSTSTSMVKTAADGSYFFGLAAGTYTLLFYSPIGAYHGSSGLVREQANAAPIALSGTNDIEIDVSIPLPTNGIWKLLPAQIGNAQLVAVADLLGSDVTAYAATIPAGSFTNEILAAMGKTKADIVEVASARDHPELDDLSTATISIDATRYSGASADQIIGAYETAFGQQAAAQQSGCSASRGTLAGKVVLMFACNGTPSSLYVYAHEDVLFEITAKDRATAEAVIAALP